MSPEADRCDVCKCTFGIFRRRYQCSCCGRTLCHEHSLNHMEISHFGIKSNVRVCANCFNSSSRSREINPQASLDVTGNLTDELDRLDVAEVEPNPKQGSGLHTLPCNCGMPLCICKPPALISEMLPKEPNPKPKMKVIPKSKATISCNKSMSDISHSQLSNLIYKPEVNYEANGEGLREAIKNGDVVAVKKLLAEGVDANYCDKQGLSVLHLAALFDKTDIVFLLMESGASSKFKNAQGETPLDCAPVTLQNKMRNKLEETNLQD